MNLTRVGKADLEVFWKAWKSLQQSGSAKRLVLFLCLPVPQHQCQMNRQLIYQPRFCHPAFCVDTVQDILLLEMTLIFSKGLIKCTSKQQSIVQRLWLILGIQSMSAIFTSLLLNEDAMSVIACNQGNKFGHASAANFYCIAIEVVNENGNKQLFKCFFLLTLGSYSADVRCEHGRLTLRKNLILSQKHYQWPAFAQSGDTRYQVLLQACFAAN